MPSTDNWWSGKIDWNTPAGRVLEKFLCALPQDRPVRLTLYGSAPLQLTIDPALMSGDVDIFADDDSDVSGWIEAAGLDRKHGGFYIELGSELSFRTSPRWRRRAIVIKRANVELSIPHPLDILIGKLSRLDEKDLQAFRRVIQITGHPTPDELIAELQHAVDLFRPNFDEDSPNRLPQNTERLWRELFNAEINVQADIITPAIQRRRQGYGEEPPDYKAALKG